MVCLVYLHIMAGGIPRLCAKANTLLNFILLKYSIVLYLPKDSSIVSDLVLAALLKSLRKEPYPNRGKQL